MDNQLKIIECIIDTEIFEKLSTYNFKIIDFSPKIIGLRAVIGVVNQRVVSCAIMDYSRTLPNNVFYEIFYCFDKEIENIQNEINFLNSRNKSIEKNSGKSTMIDKYKSDIAELEGMKAYFRYNDFYYVVFLESLVKGNNYGSEIVEYIKNKYKDVITLPFPKTVSVFWEHNNFKEINYMYYYKEM